MKTWIALAAFVAWAALPTSIPAQEPPALAAIKDPAEKARVQKLIEDAEKKARWRD